MHFPTTLLFIWHDLYNFMDYFKSFHLFILTIIFSWSQIAEKFQQYWLFDLSLMRPVSFNQWAMWTGGLLDTSHTYWPRNRIYFHYPLYLHNISSHPHLQVWLGWWAGWRRWWRTAGTSSCWRTSPGCRWPGSWSLKCWCCPRGARRGPWGPACPHCTAIWTWGEIS